MIDRQCAEGGLDFCTKIDHSTWLQKTRIPMLIESVERDILLAHSLGYMA
jgi:hypothetical protein